METLRVGKFRLVLAKDSVGLGRHWLIQNDPLLLLGTLIVLEDGVPCFECFGGLRVDVAGVTFVLDIQRGVTASQDFTSSHRVLGVEALESLAKFDHLTLWFEIVHGHILGRHLLQMVD